MWPRLFEGMIHPSYTAMDKTRTAIKAIIPTLLIYILLAAAYMFIFSGPTMDQVIDNALLWMKTPKGVIIFIAQTAWRYIIFHLITVAAMFIVYDQALRALNMEKRLLKTGEIIYKRKEEEEKEPVEKKEKKTDPYAELITELKKFAKKLDKVDRITAAQLMSRFKNEFNVLSAKHETESKKTVEKMLDRLEEEMEKRFG
jgi:hypothetical protein